MLNLVIFGPPGAGKGTQAALIAKQFKLNHLSSGKLLRDNQEDQKTKSKIKKYQIAGKLVPDYLVIKIVEDAIQQGMKGAGIILDGYPRNLSQARALDKFFRHQKTQIDLVLNIRLSEKEAVRRIMLRAGTSGRADDNIQTIENRFKVYHAKTTPVLNYYRAQKKIITIDDRPSIVKVFQQIKKTINIYLESTDKY